MREFALALAVALVLAVIIVVCLTSARRTRYLAQLGVRLPFARAHSFVLRSTLLRDVEDFRLIVELALRHLALADNRSPSSATTSPRVLQRTRSHFVWQQGTGQPIHLHQRQVEANVVRFVIKEQVRWWMLPIMLTGAVVGGVIAKVCFVLAVPVALIWDPSCHTGYLVLALREMRQGGK